MQHDVRERHDTTAEPTIGQLVSDLSTEVSQLVHDEMRLARVEMTEKAKGLGVGAGMFGAVGVMALRGRRRVQEATPPVPTRTVENVQRDVAAVREAREHSHQH